MAYRLVTQIGSRQVREPLAEGMYRIGSGTDADIVLREPTISRQHATLEVQADRLTLTDTGSRNGTFVRHKRIESARVKPEDAIRLGELDIHIESIPAGDLEAAVPGRKPDNQRAPMTSVATIATEFKSRFLALLPALISRLASGHDTQQIATALARSISEADSTVGVEILEGGGVLASVPRADNPLTERKESGNYTITIRYADRQSQTAIRTIAQTALDLLNVTDGERVRPSSLAGRPQREAAEMPRPATLYTPLKDIYDQAQRVAAAEINVLITGATGTGKELLARYLHQASGLPEDKFIALNCAALPVDLLEAELFGIEAKVATGVGERAGKFELAHGGTLFLDEIGDMSMATQAKLLRVLQERQVYRVGGHSPYPAEVKVISATNQPIEEHVESNAFRRDLFHRVADWTVRLPSLAERAVDIPNLAAHFLREECEKGGIHFGGISRAAMNCLQSYPWPGNVRELEREMVRAAVFLNAGEMLDSNQLQERFRDSGAVDSAGGLQLVVETAERQAIESALIQSDGNVDQAARFLDIGKSTLYRRMKHLGLG